MTLLDKIRLAILGPALSSLEEAEAAYQSAKARYSEAQSRGDKRGMGEAWRAMNRALNKTLAHSDASRLHTHRASFGSRSRSARAV